MMLRCACVLFLWMHYAGASTSLPARDPSSVSHKESSTIVPSTASSYHVVTSNSHVIVDQSDWSGVSLSTLEITKKSKSWLDDTSLANTGPIRPTSSSEYLNTTGTNSYTRGVTSNQGETDTLTEEIAEASTYYEENLLSSIRIGYSVNQGNENDKSYVDLTVLPSHPSAISEVTSFNMEADDMDSSVDLSVNPSTEQESMSLIEALDVITLSAFDESDIIASEFQSIAFDTYSTLQSDRGSRSVVSVSAILENDKNTTSAQSHSNSTSENATSTLENTTSAPDNTTSGSVIETRMCRCDCHYAANLKLYRNATAVNITSDEVQKELKKQVTNLQKQLSINKTNLSSAKRKKTSMNDDRASARGVGLIGVGMLVMLMGGLVLMDLTTIKRDFQRLRNNVGHCCKESNNAC